MLIVEANFGLQLIDGSLVYSRVENKDKKRYSRQMEA